MIVIDWEARDYLEERGVLRADPDMSGRWLIGEMEVIIADGQDDEAEGGRKILAGLMDALAYARGDESKVRVTHAYVPKQLHPKTPGDWAAHRIASAAGEALVEIAREDMDSDMMEGLVYANAAIEIKVAIEETTLDLEDRLGEAYQLVGNALEKLGVFDTPEAERVLDVLGRVDKAAFEGRLSSMRVAIANLMAIIEALEKDATGSSLTAEDTDIIRDIRATYSLRPRVVEERVRAREAADKKGGQA
jgi:hypothetical protein